MIAAPRRRLPAPSDPARARFERRLLRLLRQSGILPAAGRRAWVALDRRDDVSLPIRRAQEYVAGHVEEVRALDELAEAAGLSRYHFARRFRDEVGEPPWAYVRRLRAERAHALLQEGATPAEAAHAAGFADQAHLTRSLRERYGRTPGQLRRRPDRDAADRKDVQEPEATAE